MHRCNIVIAMCSASGTSLPDPTFSGGSRICPKRGSWRARAHRESKRGSGAPGAPSGVQRQSPWWGVQTPSELGPKLKLFVHFHTISGQKFRI